MKDKRIVISPPERRELDRRVRSRTIGAEDARRAQVILALGSGLGVRAVASKLKCSTSYIQRWRERFLASRLSGLVARHQGRKVRPDAAKLEARILEWTRRGPRDGTTHWSSRRLAAALGTNHMTVSRVWARHGLQPHRLRRYMLSEDPDFEQKAADIIGLYLNPPDHAAVFCVDEKTAIQALDRLDPVLPLSPGRAEASYTHGFSLYPPEKSLADRQRISTRRFLAQVVASQPRGREIHVIADNLSAHKTKLVDDFLATHPQVRIHFTPTYSSWLNQVEIWFAKIQRQVIARGIFSSVEDLRRKILRYIRHYNKTATPIKWTYSSPAKRINA